MAKQKFICGYCKKGYTNERTLSSHMCVKKRRHIDKNTVASRMGLELFRRFYELNTATKAPKSVEEFIDSKYYSSFIKLAKHIMDLRPVDQARFVDYVFQSGVKDRDWCKDRVYEAYILDLLQKEASNRALERSIQTMQQWAEETGNQYTEFFAKVSPQEATHLIRMGKISPWVLYLSETADGLWERLSDEQAEMIGQTINPKVWKARFQKKAEDCNFVRDILREAGI